MDLPGIIRDPQTRGDFLRAAGMTFAAGSAASLVACGGDDDRITTSAGVEGTSTDIGILAGALARELTAIDAYSRMAGLLSGPLRAVGEAFLAHEQEHANVLTKAIKQLGGEATTDPIALDFGAVRSERDGLELASDLEQVAIATYLEAVPKLSTANLRTTAVQIAIAEAEHLAVLQGALGRPPAPRAFVGGDPEALDRPRSRGGRQR
jgi:rubrerythrin